MSPNNSNNTSEPIYKYYIETTSVHHYPTATELAEFLGINSKYGQLYPGFITAYMDSIGADKMYYFGKNGKARVINNWGMVIQMLVLLNAKMNEKKENLSERDRVNYPEYGEIIELDVDRACEDYQRHIPDYDDYDEYLDSMI